MNKKISATFAIIVILLVGGFIAFIFAQGLNQNLDYTGNINPKIEKNTDKNINAKISNPASEHCVNNEGKLEIKTGANGSQTGFCIFKNGKECEEWAYFRGECGKIDISDWISYKNFKYGYELKLPGEWTINDNIISQVIISSEKKDFPTFEISVIPLAKKYDIDSLIRKSLPDEVKNGRSIRKEETMIDGEEGYSVSDCGKFECITQKWAVVKNDKFYFFNSKNGLMPEFEQIFATFKFL